MKDLICMIDDLNKQGINFKVLAGSGAEIDTTTANGRLVFSIFAVLAEYERELIRERTVAGLAATRARGRKGGRPAKMDKATLAIAMAALKDQKSVSTEIAKKLGLTTITLYKYVNGDGSLKEMGDKLMAK
jgi:DNA invertase Pin-like site-specific DNA recombinase